MWREKRSLLFVPIILVSIGPGYLFIKDTRKFPSRVDIERSIDSLTSSLSIVPEAPQHLSHPIQPTSTQPASIQPASTEPPSTFEQSAPSIVIPWWGNGGWRQKEEPVQVVTEPVEVVEDVDLKSANTDETKSTQETPEATQGSTFNPLKGIFSLRPPQVDFAKIACGHAVLVIVQGKYPSVEDEPVIRHIWEHQHPQNCSKMKFIVWKFPPKSSSRNIGSIYTNAMRWLPQAMVHDRILIFDDRDWSLADCPSKNSECYFEPITNCSIKDLDSVPPSERFQIKDLTKAGVTRLVHAHRNTRIWKAPASWWMHEDTLKLEAWFWPAKSLQHGCRTWSAAIYFMLRPKQWVQKAVDARLAGSFPPDFDPTRTVGMPIRASDKCFGHRVRNSAPGERQCLPPEKFWAVAEKIREYDPTVDTVLLSSEDRSWVAKLTQLAAASAKKWRVVTNKGDHMAGSGSATYFQQLSKKGNFSLREQMVDALSSLQFQMRSRYLLVSFDSSFLLLMHVWHLSDSGTFSNRRMQIDMATVAEVNWQPSKLGPLTRFQC